MKRVMFALGLLMVIASALLLFFVGERAFWGSLGVLAVLGIIMIGASRVRLLR